jgi:hypothetical protein
MRYLLATLSVILVFEATAVNAQQFEWEGPLSPGYAGKPYFDQEHHDDYVLPAIGELTGSMPPASASRAELAQIVAGLLGDLPEYGQKEVAMVKPAIPEWFLSGYLSLNPTSVSHSRYLDSVAAHEMAANGEIGALYAFWCVYDAEWFSLSRHADYKAWLSAVLLQYPPKWQDLRGETSASLHDRLVAPLQTPDEPYREIDNWINNFTSNNEAFAKPKVRDALVQELVGQAGMEADTRFVMDAAYGGPTPDGLGLSVREFYLLAALSLEFFQELYELDPQDKQLLHFRDYFIDAYYHNAG